MRGLFLEGLIFGGAYLWREICVSKIDWASLIVGGKFTVFALFYFVLGGNFPSTSPRGAYIWRGGLMDGFFFLHYRFGGLYLEGLIHGGAYFRNFTVLANLSSLSPVTVPEVLSLSLHIIIS